MVCAILQKFKMCYQIDGLGKPYFAVRIGQVSRNFDKFAKKCLVQKLNDIYDTNGI